MPKPARQIGEIFVQLGRITPEDVERALAFQRESGGYFGEALVALGLLTREEVRWGLADQHDLPVVQMHPEQIDPAVARQVPAAWARAHQMLPVLRHGDSLIVVMADPAAREHYDELRQLTGAESIDGAVASAETVGELIDYVFGGLSGEEVDVSEWLAGTLLGGASTLGISVRGSRAMGWSPDGGGARHWLRPGWRHALRPALSAWPDAASGQVCEWTALLRAGSGVWRVRCHLMGTGAALEWVAEVEERLSHDPAAIAAEPELRQQVKARLAEGPLLLRVHPGEPAGRTLLGEAIPLLPSALLGGAARVAHLGDAGCASPTGVVTLRIPREAAKLATLAPFALDALTLDWEEADPALIQAACAVAPLVVCRAGVDAAAECAVIDVRLRSDGGVARWARAE